MDADKLRARKAQLEKERESVRQQAQSALDRLTGALLLLDELIAEVERDSQRQTPD